MKSLRRRDALGFFGGHLPLIGRVRLLDIDGDQGRFVGMLSDDLEETRTRAPQTRSGKAPDDEDERLLANAQLQRTPCPIDSTRSDTESDRCNSIGHGVRSTQLDRTRGLLGSKPRSPNNDPRPSAWSAGPGARRSPTFSPHTASPPPPSGAPAGSRASSRSASIAPRTTSARGRRAWGAR